MAVDPNPMMMCLFCRTDLQGRGAVSVNMHKRDTLHVECPVCGTYDISGTPLEVLKHLQLTDQQRAAIFFNVRRMTERPEVPFITAEVLEALRQTAVLPRPESILDEAIVWLGKRSPYVGFCMNFTYEQRAVVGAFNRDAFNFVARWFSDSGYFFGKQSNPPLGQNDYLLTISEWALTPAGWERFTELSKEESASKYGFMAMKYNDAQLDQVVKDFFAPEVKKTDFELRRLDHGQGAGLIDDQLRVSIRTARFMVCDLTHGNRGAYWEAGFAEGLGKPVIYTCRKDVFEDGRSTQTTRTSTPDTWSQCHGIQQAH